MSPTNPTPFPKPGDAIQVTVGMRIQLVTVTKAFPDAQQIVGKLASSQGQDPRGDFLVAELQHDRWMFRHSLTPEQAGERAQTPQEKAAVERAKPKLGE